MKKRTTLLEIKSGGDKLTHILMKQIVGEYLEMNGYEVAYEKTFFVEKVPRKTFYQNTHSFDSHFAPLYYSLDKTTKELIGCQNKEQTVMFFGETPEMIHKRYRADVIGNKLKQRIIVECITNSASLEQFTRTRTIWKGLGILIIAINGSAKITFIEKCQITAPDIPIWGVDLGRRLILNITTGLLQIYR